MVNWLVPTRAWGQFLASFSRLRFQNSSDIFLGSWTWLSSGIALFLWPIVMFSWKPLGGWEWGSARSKCIMSYIKEMAVVFKFVHRPDIWKRFKLAIAIQGHLSWGLLTATGLRPLGVIWQRPPGVQTPSAYTQMSACQRFKIIINHKHAFGSGLHQSPFREWKF